ncbi:ribosomal protein L5 domain-containing protein, partial [Chytridium lagenaria]
IVRNRLEEHYYRSLVEDIMVLRYRHESKDAPSVEKVDAMLAELSQSAHASLDAQTPLTLNPTRRSDLLRVFSTPLSHLPTYPSTNSSSTAVTNLLAKRTADASGPGRNVRRLWRRRLVNPIDYTTVRRSAMESFLMGEKEREVRMEKGKSFSPNVARLPAIRKVVVKIWEESAVVNKNVLLGAIMSLQAITGVHASPLFAVHGDASKKIRAGMPMGAVVELSGPRAFEFLDKLIQVVLPRLREWEGVDPFKKDAPRVLLQPGTITIKLPESVMGSFPDIEPHYEMFPRLFAATVTVHTSATDLEGAALVLSGFQMPFLKDAMPEVASADETKEDDDPFAKFKKRKEPAGGARRGGGKK